MKRSAKTSWGEVADWYTEHLAQDDTYHAKVVAPNLMRMVAVKQDEVVLDLACGEGYFSRLLRAKGVQTMGVDISPELISAAKKKDASIEYHIAPAESTGLIAHSCDAITCVLALQNMERPELTCKEVARLLKPDGRFIAVINHPAFRIPKKSAWGYDEEKSVQYRIIEGYLTPTKTEIVMTPGSRKKVVTLSYHRSLQDYFKALRSAGLAVTRLEEWISHKESEKGPRKSAEDLARKEFPLFMAFECRPFKINEA
jgi:ubiquinone/menaquinone biosynthesis C-methylase UbiE